MVYEAGRTVPEKSEPAIDRTAEALLYMVDVRTEEKRCVIRGDLY